MKENNIFKNAKQDLVDIFKNAEKDRFNYLLGLEIEHFVLEKNSLEAVSYYQEQGIEDILIKLSNKYDYKRKYEDNHIVGLENRKYSVSLEPGGQIELGLKPQATLEEIEKIYNSFLKEIVPILENWNKIIVNIGYQPVTSIKDIPLLPKKRYDYMYKYFKDQGKYAHNMMKGTASIQVNIDYSNEEDYIKKNKVINYLSPLIYVAFDNSPFFEGEVCKNKSMRANIWDYCDKKRCGFSQDPFKDDFGYEKYAEYILKTPPILINKNDNLIYTGDKVFKEIYANKEYNKKELKHLLTMAFPDVRTKQYIEIRMGDSLPYPYMMGFLAFWKGLLYHQDNLNLLYKKASKVSKDDVLKIKEEVKSKGKKALFDGLPLMEQYRNLLSLAHKGLNKCELDYLKELEELAEKNIVPKEKTLKLFDQNKQINLNWCDGSTYI